MQNLKPDLHRGVTLRRDDLGSVQQMAVSFVQHRLRRFDHHCGNPRYPGPAQQLQLGGILFISRQQAKEHGTALHQLISLCHRHAHGAQAQRPAARQLIAGPRANEDVHGFQFH